MFSKMEIFAPRSGASNQMRLLQISSSYGSSVVIQFKIIHNYSIKMSYSPTKSPCSNAHVPEDQQTIPINRENLHEKIHGSCLSNQIPVEIVSEEEMALLEAAVSLAAATRPSSLSPSSLSRFSVLCSHLGRNSKRAVSNLAGPSSVRDVEDSGRLVSPSKKCKVPETFLNRFRRKKGLYVTDITATEWCEKQMEFILLFGKPESTPAMKAGSTRHAKLEQEVGKKVEVHVESLEDIWALKFMNFIICANQLLFEGLTREVPVVGLVQGVWMVGVIDELRMPVAGEDRNLMLVDTKTRVRPRLPTEPQGRNGRLQLMCYKYLWDNLASEKFPSDQFFEYFSLDSRYILSDEIKRLMVDSDFTAETLGDIVGHFSNFCSVLPCAQDQLLLRYELQEDNSLIGEDEFPYDDNWLKAQIQSSLEFWQGEREARLPPPKEHWKCRYCQFASVCPSQTDAYSHMSSK